MIQAATVAQTPFAKTIPAIHITINTKIKVTDAMSYKKVTKFIFLFRDVSFSNIYF